MGQYYRFINIDKKQKCDRNQGMLKLMEHSYLDDEYCDDILSLISNEWKGDRILHVGDYAEGGDGTTTSELIHRIEKENNLNKNVYDWGEKFKEIEPRNVDSKIRYIYNLNRKEYIDLEKQPIQRCFYENDKIYFSKFNIFALLIACGNEQGGGDYFGINRRKIGLWAGDRFVSSASLLKEYSNFKEQKYIFNECLQLNNRIKNINEKSERQILNAEGIVLKKFLNWYKDYCKMDFSKIKIDKGRLTDGEFKYLNSILKKYKKRELYKQKNLDNKIEKEENKSEKNSSIDEVIL